MKKNVSSPAEYREAMRGEGDPGGNTIAVSKNSHSAFFSLTPIKRSNLGSLPSRRFAALAGNDNIFRLEQL